MILKRRRTAYQAIFLDDHNLKKQADVILDDLARFCHFYTPHAASGSVDPYAIGVGEGRREVFLRILAFIKMSEEQLAERMRVDND